jgi:protein ImuA
MTTAARNFDLASLRAMSDQIGRGEGTDDILPFGLPMIDRVLPDGGLRRGALHEIQAAPDDAAGIGFALALASRAAAGGAILWCQAGPTPDPGPLYGPGLAQFGVPPSSLLIARPAKPVEVLWAMEEGLRTGAVAVVVGTGVVPDMVASRRLQLAARTHGRLALLVLPRRTATPPSSAETRWAIASAPVRGQERDWPRWDLTLRRCRRGSGWDTPWRIHWDPLRSIFVPG